MAIQKYSTERQLKKSRANIIRLNHKHIKLWGKTTIRKRRLWALYYFTADD